MQTSLLHCNPSMLLSFFHLITFRTQHATFQVIAFAIFSEGHYVAHTRFDDTWFLCNDSYISTSKFWQLQAQDTVQLIVLQKQ